MAKNKVFIDVVVDDKGTTKRLAVDADKLGASLEKTSTSARTADRNLKGAARTSANSTKNFSKMAQGITGGLVPAYATLAAQVFAITAAFDFFRRAADVRNLEEQQKSFAERTGTALGAMTSRLREASGGMLGFKEAAQATAIGVAKGFSASQMEQLAEGARKASTALGRDFEDAFDRLVRGVSKAEPELLDELGITLRLENATNRYSAALGKNVKALTETERSQAVLLEVQRQIDQQFGNVDPDQNAFIELSKTFSDLTRDITKGVLPAFEFVADILNKNAKAAALFFGLLILSIVKTIPGMSSLTGFMKSFFVSLNPLAGAVNGFKNMGGAVAEFGRDSKKAITDAIDDYKAFQDSVDRSVISVEELQRKASKKAKGVAGQMVADGTRSKTVQKVAEGTANKRDITILKKALKRAEKEYQKHGEIVSGIFEGEDIKRLRHLKDALDDMEREHLKFSQRVKNISKKTGLAIRAGITPAVISLKAAFKGVAATAKFAGKAINAAMKATVILGIISSIVQAFESLFNAPATLARGIIKMISTMAKGIQFFANLVIDLINGLVNKLPDRLKKMLGLEEGEVMIQPLTFADNFDEKFTTLIDETFPGVMDSLQEFENKQNEVARRQELLDGLINQYGELADAIRLSKVAATDQNKTAEERSRARIEGTASLGVSSKLRKTEALVALDPAAGQQAIAAFRDELRNSGLEEINKELFDAAMALNTKRVEDLELFASTYIGTITELKSKTADLPGLFTGDPKAIERGLIEIELAASKADELAGKLGESSEAGQILGEVLGGRLSAIREEFTAIRQTADQLALQALELQGDKLEAEALSGRFREERLKDIAVLEAQNALLELQNQLKAINNALDVTGEGELIGTAREDKEAEKARVQEQINNQNTVVENAKRNANDFESAGIRIGNTLQSSFQSAFQGLVEGTMTAKQAFASMAKSILSMIAKIITELLVAKILTAALGGGPVGNFLGIPKPRYGGVFDEGRYGGVMPKGYGVGGVAKGPDGGYPAILHGTEAVVPLPNNRSIPVDLQGRTGDENNVVVNVTIANDGSTQQDAQASTRRGADMGKLVAAAVQEELLNQKRSGGILNPMGVA